MINWNRVAALREEVGPEDFDEVVELFLLEVDGEINLLNNKHDAHELAGKLHFLKGSALSLGFEAFSDLCEKGEQSLKTGAPGDVDISQLTDSYKASRVQFVTDLPTRFSDQTSL